MYKQVFKLHAQLLRALANPKRLEIMQLLRSGSLRVGDMSRMLGLEQANLSQHLMVLRRLKVVATERQGKEIYYRLAHKNFIKAADMMRQILFERLGGKATQAERMVSVVTDPVCGMHITPASAATSLTQGSKIYYFCGTGCKKDFSNLNK
jgi:DNA-binding transcriptional ArsR family regulator